MPKCNSNSIIDKSNSFATDCPFRVSRSAAALSALNGSNAFEDQAKLESPFSNEAFGQMATKVTHSFLKTNP